MKIKQAVFELLQGALVGASMVGFVLVFVWLGEVTPELLGIN